MGLARVWAQYPKRGVKVVLAMLYACGVWALWRGFIDRLLITFFFLIPSVNNYPGGHALLKMNVGLELRCDP